MSIRIEVLGSPGEDNATLVEIDSGSSLDRVLFDCGGGVLDGRSVSEIQSIGHLCLSHFHMDHICGFDTFFRHNYNRDTGPVHVWGPAGSTAVMAHRFGGFVWNLHHHQAGEWRIHEVADNRAKTTGFVTSEAFANEHSLGETPAGWDESGRFELKTIELHHGSIPSIGYRIEEPDRLNIDPEQLAEFGQPPGRWLADVKNSELADESTTELPDGSSSTLGDLRADLMRTSSGASMAYLTDFYAETGSGEWEDLVAWLSQVDTLVCECQYRHSDEALAQKNSHMTTTKVAQLASDAGVNELILQHVSRRYETADWREMLSEAQQIFPESKFPVGWSTALSS